MLRGDGSLGLHLEHFLQVLDEARVLLSERAFMKGAMSRMIPGSSISRVKREPSPCGSTLSVRVGAILPICPWSSRRRGGSYFATLSVPSEWPMNGLNLTMKIEPCPIGPSR